MDIATDAKVECTDGSGGHVTGIVVDPASRKVTHLIVKGPGMFSTHKLVDIINVTSSEHGVIKLNVVRDMLDAMQAYLKPDDYKKNSSMIHYQTTSMDLAPNWGQYYEPANMPVGDRAFDPSASAAAIDQSLDEDEVVAENHIKVEAQDGHVGKLAGVEVAGDMTVTYLLVKGSHKDIRIPLTSVDYVSKGIVYLNVNKGQAEAQP